MSKIESKARVFVSVDKKLFAYKVSANFLDIKGVSIPGTSIQEYVFSRKKAINKAVWLINYVKGKCLYNENEIAIREYVDDNFILELVETLEKESL